MTDAERAVVAAAREVIKWGQHCSEHTGKCEHCDAMEALEKAVRELEATL